MRQTMSVAEWAGLLQEGKKLVFTKDGASKISDYVQRYCGFELKTSPYGGGRVALVKESAGGHDEV